MAVHSKFIPITCREYVHPWVSNCGLASLGLCMHAFQHCLKTYAAVYALSLVMRRRIPTLQDLLRAVLGLLRSSAFLTTAAYAFPAWCCILRRSFGGFSVPTTAFIPCFLTSIMAISIERPSRRPLLSLYVANVGGETLWRMLEHRNYVKSTQAGQILLFGLSASILTYFYRKSYHLKIPKESLFSLIKYMVGDIGVEQVRTQPPRKVENWPGKNFCLKYGFIAWIIKYYRMLVAKLAKLPKNSCCPHRDSCISYGVRGGLKLFGTGLGIQIGLKLIFQLKKIIRQPKSLFSKDTFNLAIFLGGFSAIFRTVSCLLRTITKRDDATHVFPAVLAASTTLRYYPDNSIVLYIMWKCLQTAFGIGVDRGYWKPVPFFTEAFYCFWTSILFHGALLEPTTLRSNYWRFLMGLSGGRIASMDRVPLDAFGLETTKKLHIMLDKTHTKIRMDYHW